MKIIAHIDIDSFFVSVERINNPKLKNLPIAIAEDHSNSIVTSLSYEAKNKGAKVPWLLSKVKKLVPDIIAIKPNYGLYSALSIKFFNFLKSKITKEIEIVSIDECFLDVSEFSKKFSSLEMMGKKIQQEILKHLKLPVTIGISHNKFLAKMTTNLAKPFGVKYLPLNEIKNQIFPLSIKSFYGIGEASIEKLKKLNINTINDFIQLGFDNENLKKIFGIRINKMFDNLLCKSGFEIEKEAKELKSISIFHTFINKTDNYQEIFFTLKNLSINISLRAKERNIKGNKISLIISKNFNDKKIHKTIKIEYTNNEENIFNNVKKIWQEIWDEKTIKGIGINFLNLKKEYQLESQKSIFLDSNNLNIDNLINKINFNLGYGAIKTLKRYWEEEQRKEIRDKKFGETYKDKIK